MSGPPESLVDSVGTTFWESLEWNQSQRANLAWMFAQVDSQSSLFRGRFCAFTKPQESLRIEQV